MGDRPSSFARSRQNALPKQPQQEQLFDTHPEVSLDFEIVRQAARQRYSRPFLIIDTAIVRGKVRRFRAAMPRVRPHYAVKANPDRRVLKVLVQEGAGFEIASTAELELLLGLGVAPAEIFFSNPVKSRESIACAAAKGVEWFVVDSADELRRIHETRADAKQYLRIAAPNIGSDWPLSGKFGGGFPVRHVKPIPSVEVIGEVVNECLKAFPEDVQVIAEPGRFLVSDAGYFVCRVLGTATRAGQRWMHWDAGLFGGVIESSEGLKYRIRTERSGPDIPWTVGGPTCDSVDIVMRDEPLPSDLQEGDFVYIKNAGAYTTAYASQFNGFPLPEVRVFESKR